MGSTYMQKEIYALSKETLRTIFFEILPEIPFLINNYYGNYVIHHLYNLIDLNERILFLNQIRNNITYISKCKVGTFPLQRIVEYIKSEAEEKVLIDSLSNEKVLSLYNNKP